MQSAATRIAREKLHIENFTASNRCLEKFHARDCIVAKLLCGEKASASVKMADEFQQELPKILSDYSEDCILNSDKICLFWKEPVRKTQ